MCAPAGTRGTPDNEGVCTMGSTAHPDSKLPALLDFFGELTRGDELGDLERSYCRGVAKLVPHTMRAIYLFDRNGTLERVAAENVSDFFLARYEEVGRAVDPLFSRLQATKAPVDNMELMSFNGWLESDIYREVVQMNGVNYTTLAPVIVDDRLAGVLAWASPAKRGTASPEERELLAGIGRIVGLAVDVVRQREAAATAQQRLAGALDCMPSPVIVSNGREGTRTFNAKARKLMDELRNGEGLLNHLTARVGGRVPGHSEAEIETRSGRRSRVTAQSYELPEMPGTIVTVLQEQGPTPAVSLTTIVEPRLTEREQQVAELIVDGMTSGEVAERLFLSPHTVRQHLKQIYRKLGVNSRAALTRMLLADSVRGRAELER